MYWSRLIPVLWTLLFLNDSVHCQGEIPETDNTECISGAKSERLKILATLLDLKSSVGFLAGSIEDLDRRVRSIENLVKDTEAKTTKKIEGLEKLLLELTHKMRAENAESRNPESSLSGAAQVTNTQMDSKAGKVLTGVERMSKIEMIVQNPKATFFMGENLTGAAVNYDSTTAEYAGGCQGVTGIKSLQTSQTCVRVFQQPFCTFISRALYPRPNSGSFINFLTPELNNVESVGPCLPNEFQYASLSLNGSDVFITKDESYLRQVPDIANFYGNDLQYYLKSTLVDSPSNSVNRYYTDAEGRPEWIRADIYRRHIHDKPRLAVLGLAIPPELGGPTNETYNSFPQSQRNFEEWRRITDQIHSNRKAKEASWDDARVRFVYESPATLKPYGFYYWVALRTRGYNHQIMYGFIEN